MIEEQDSTRVPVPLADSNDSPVSRETLYKMVWSEPMLRVAAHFGVSLLLLPLFVFAGETIELKVDGMYCQMCAYGLQSSLKEMQGVKDAKVDYDGKTCRVEMIDGKVADIDAINKLIIESGFAPGDVTKIN
ncbi:heavy-metal-associated domain-containing protein [Pseudomonadota bacterium]